jgi:hypothetical protein
MKEQANTLVAVRNDLLDWMERSVMRHLPPREYEDEDWSE